MADWNKGTYSHFEKSILNKEKSAIEKISRICMDLCYDQSMADIARAHNISTTKVSRIKKKYFPTLPRTTRDGKGAIRARQKQQDQWRTLNARDKRIVRMLQTQTYRAVAEKNDVSIGTVHNIAHFYSDQLTNRKIKRKVQNRLLRENVL